MQSACALPGKAAYFLCKIGKRPSPDSDRVAPAGRAGYLGVNRTRINHLTNRLAYPDHPLVALAPLAGITDLPFRRRVSRFGADVVTSEMVASQEMVQAKASVRARAELGLDQAATAVQLAGRDPVWMGEAARLVADLGARVIDINMGCPAKKVTSGASGAALMRDLPLARRLIAAVVAASPVPVTLKCRLGWDTDQRNAVDLARMAEDLGVQRLVIHGRTRQQFYKGRADWHAIAEVVQAVRIPVLANGDITDAATARAALDASGASGVMIGRGAQGRPWALADIRAALTGGPAPDVPKGQALFDLIVAHYEDMLGFYGLDLGRRIARKHLDWYLAPLAPPPALRQAILTSRDPDAVIGLVRTCFDRRDGVAA